MTVHVTYLCPVCGCDFGGVDAEDEVGRMRQQDIVDLVTDRHAMVTGHDEPTRFAAQQARRPQSPRMLAHSAHHEDDERLFGWLDAEQARIAQKQREWSGARDIRIVIVTDPLARMGLV